MPGTLPPRARCPISTTSTACASIWNAATRTSGGSASAPYELASPGAVLPGVVGGIALLLGLYGIGTLSPNWAGLLFIALAFLMFIAEIKVQSHGALAVGAIVSMFIGGTLLTANSPPWARISPITIALSTAWTAAIFLFIIGAAVRALHRPVKVGPEALIGRQAVARTNLQPEGMVFLDGSRWEAVAFERARSICAINSRFFAESAIPGLS